MEPFIPFFCFEKSRGDPLTRLAEFTLSPFAPLRAVRSGMANGLATLSPQGARAVLYLFLSNSWTPVPE